MEILQKKLKRLKPCLSAFNKLHYANISKKVALKRKELKEIQMLNVFNTISVDMIEKEKKGFGELHDLMVAEENFFKQSLESNDFKRGIKHKKFHGMVAVREHRNSTISLIDVNGNKLKFFS